MWECDRPGCRAVVQQLVVGEFVVGGKHWVGFGLALDLLDLGQLLVAVAGRRPRGVDRATLLIDVDGEHVTVGQIGIVGDRKQFVAGLALRVHPLPEIARDRSIRSELNGISGTFAQSLKKTLRCMLRLSGVDVHS